MGQTETVIIEAVQAPVANRKEGVRLWNPGDQAEVAWSGFWQGQLERGAITLAPGTPGAGSGASATVPAAAEPEAQDQEPEAGPAGPASAAVAPFWARWFQRPAAAVLPQEEERGNNR